MPYAIDLFCGAGGCSEGLIQAGFDILFSSDISPMVEKTYMNRHKQLGLIQGENTWFELSDIRNLSGEIIQERISSLTIFQGKKIPEIDLMIGGPSCQGFSRAGRRDKHDPRNLLFGEYVRIIKEVQPKYIVLENVEGFMDMQFYHYLGITGTLYPDGTTTPEILKKELESIGYKTLEPQILNAADYGVPQNRRRVIFIGYKEGYKAPEYPSPFLKRVSVKEAIGDLCDIFPKSDYAKESKRGRTPDIHGHPVFADTLTNHEFPKQKDLVLERFSLYKEGETTAMLRKRIMEKGIDLSDCPALVAWCSQKLRKGEEEIVEGFRSGGGDKNALDVLLTKKNIRKRLSMDAPAATVLTIADDYIHPVKNRTFSVRELARLQSFDDSFVFLGPRTTGGLRRRVDVPQYTQVGNAVPPLLAKVIALEIAKILA